MNSEDHNRTKTILDSIVDGVFTVDRDFRITLINRSAEKILKIDARDAIGKPCHEIFNSNICQYSCALKETIKTGESIVNKTIYIIDQDGKKIPISINTSILRDEEGGIVGGVETFRDITEVSSLRKTIKSTYTFEDIVSKNKKMQNIFAILPDIAEGGSSVIIEGASGTGKELIAHAIHNISSRNSRRLVPVNCAAMPETLIESELFGYKSGAFTDAKKDKPGKIALAEGGTLFLDEVGELSLSVQAKLLRFMQDRKYEPLGGINTVTANVRIIAATNKNLSDEVAAKRFREDLFYRLNVMRITLPSLKERMEDLPLLIRHFISMYNVIKEKNIEGTSDEVMKILMNHQFPGNIRELENIIEHSFILCKESYIQTAHLPEYLRSFNSELTRITRLDDLERVHIEKILSWTDWNKTESAKLLGIDKSTLWRKIKRHGIE